MNFLRRGQNRAIMKLKPYEKPYTATMRITIKDKVIAKYDLELHADNRDHAFTLAKQWARASMGLDWKIKPKKR